jgi:hypothetical protein
VPRLTGKAQQDEQNRLAQRRGRISLRSINDMSHDGILGTAERRVNAPVRRRGIRTYSRE